MAMLALPGDHISIPSTSAVKLGPGLAISAGEAEEDAELITVTPGILGKIKSQPKGGKSKGVQGSESSTQTAFWIESDGRRYYPSVHDHVLCQITNRGVDAYQVTLFNTFATANLPALSFEGATKRNKPNLRVGTLIYAQIVSAYKHAEIELTCVDAATGKSNGFGELKTEREETTTNTVKKTSESTIAPASANIFPVSCGFARSLLNDKHPLLARLATHFPFEVAIGVNGYVWVRAKNVKHVIAVGKVLERADADALNEPTLAAQEGATGSTEEESKVALEIVKQRGVLDAKTISQIVDPFK
ncbi:uncharacterized protein FA14DRAFT_134220 [Meira miltonrushii]|uniref:Ribosomal RNA-processing protein 40 n=1 Tax=Meira miltonrushii TaxID=1280837 RepID=A0A316VE33_9BASI|nr:uncharacterized protein FA14DRAFT_134220 [Meira miltonrushii]PWN35832.1 hypothetical protein FA14DRAFT_134220 [Meira miltonrushii]